MKKFVVIFCMLLTAFSAVSQSFIGCRDGDGWAETAMFRKKFTLANVEIASRRLILYVTSLGYHDVYLNGHKVGDWVMQPAVSQLNKRAMTVCYDASGMLKEGENELLICVGQGWGRVYGTPASVRAEGLLDYMEPVLETDTTWETSQIGYSYTGSWQPLQFGGERFDARMKPNWRPADALPMSAIFGTVESTIPDVRMIKLHTEQQKFKGNRIVDTLMPKAVTKQPDGSVLIDFGRVLTGWFNVDFGVLTKGEVVTMEYLDHKDAKPPHTEMDEYVSDGDSGHFSNRFHMHAFRYVRVKGADVVSSSALQISAVNPKEGATFECSDPRLNAIHDMVKYTLSCLTFSGYMVDCPHLERMGYGGDGNSSTMTLQTIWDVRDTYHNWLTAWSDAMDSSGSLPYVAPAFPTGGGPYWSGFIVKAQWRTYINYGDKSLIERHYSDMKRWLGYVERYSPDGLLQPWPDEGRMWFLGDWLAPKGVDVGGESALFVSNCFIVECLADMEQMAKLTKHKADAKRFAAWHKRLLKKIHETYYHPESQTYGNGTPIDMAYALLVGIAPDETVTNAVKQKLLDDCHTKYRDHIAVGLMGVPIFTEWCIRERQTDLMATILRQPDYPGYLYMINNGATTIWESWNCGREGKEDRSRVHNCYNGIGIWFYQALAGIRPDPRHSGYKHFYIDPQPCEGIDWVKATKPTIYGDIKVEIVYDTMRNGESGSNTNAFIHSNIQAITVTVPEGTTATIFPGTKRARTLQAGQWCFEL